MDCVCRAKLDGADDRFSKLEQKRELKQFIAHARNQAMRIAGLLDFLRELDDIAASEPDLSVFAEIACLLDDGAEATQVGSADMRQAMARKWAQDLLLMICSYHHCRSDLLSVDVDLD